MESWTILIICLMYIGMIFIMPMFIKEDIEKYITLNNTKKTSFTSISAIDWLSVKRHKDHVVTICSVCFPLYLCFKYGKWYGKMFYKILIDDKDENRIASWLF